MFAQFVYGLRASFVVGALSAARRRDRSAWPSGSSAGYRGGVVDEVLSVLTNVVLVIPTLAVLIIVAAYLSVRGLVAEALLIGLTSWPWAARAIRAQTFSLASRDFVSLARLSGRGQRARDRPRDRAEHGLLPLPRLHPALRRLDPDRRVPRLPRPRPDERDVARRDDEQRRRLERAPARDVVVVRAAGLAIMAIVGGLYVMNVGLDEIFNPRLREL